jgi:hypothetical protein
LFPVPCFIKHALADFDTILPTAKEEDNTQAARGPAAALKSIANRNKVLERFGHLGPVNLEMTHVEEIIDPLMFAVNCGAGRASSKKR